MKRYRAPKAKPGQLKMQYGKLPDDNPDLCVAWGDGCGREDSRLLHNMFCSKRQRMTFGDEREKEGPVAFDQSFVDELASRGYDITTLKFSVQKVVPNAELTRGREK